MPAIKEEAVLRLDEVRFFDRIVLVQHMVERIGTSASLGAFELAFIPEIRCVRVRREKVGNVEPIDLLIPVERIAVMTPAKRKAEISAA